MFVQKKNLAVASDLVASTPERGKIPKGKLLERFTEFSRGQWIQLLTISLDCADRAMVSQSRRRRTQQDSLERELAGLKLWCAWRSCPQADKL